ncbi:MAG TPA: hypothetical protein VKT78_20690 [Fimbriimonadaceae bacterium]|nr:hypothetical protein [Fimbriimonadaceae bacterium]
MKIRCLIAAIGLLCVAVGSPAQTPPAAATGPGLLQRTLSGEFGEPVIRYNELPENYKAVDLKLNTLDLEEAYGLIGGIGDDLRGRSADLVQRAIAYLTVYWDTGRTAGWNGVEYIVAYRVELPKGLAGYGSFSPAAPANPLALQTLRLRLIRLDQVSSITPRPDLTKSGWLALVDDVSRPKTGGDGSRTAALSNVKQAALAALMYSNDFDDRLPNAFSIGQAKSRLMPYSKNAEIFKTQNPSGGALLYNVNLAKVVMGDIPNPAAVPLFYDSKAWPDGSRPVAFADGHAKIVTSDEWPAVAAELARKYKPKPAAPPAKTGKPKPGKRSP